MSIVLDRLFEVLASETGLSRSGNREYGFIRYEPNSAIAVHVKKKTVAVFFETQGREADFPAPSLMNWANESGLLASHVSPNAVFTLKSGVKNKHKLALITELPYTADADLQRSDFVSQIIAVIDLLKSKLEGIVQIKNNQQIHDSEKSGMIDDQEADAAELDKYVFIAVPSTPWFPDYDSFEDEELYNEFKSGVEAIMEGIAERVDENATFYTLPRLHKDLKPVRINTGQELYDVYAEAKRNGVEISDKLALVMIIAGCHHWDYNFIKASSWTDSEFRIFGYYPDIDGLSTQGYTCGDYDTGVCVAADNGIDPNAYSLSYIEREGFAKSDFDLTRYG